ncbi:Ubiquitin carboxyl-terminal hydrolase 48 [Strongyloides ratti]|uniref:ubiquitinyl hydrolase 1 n=1 Tax=Strongyloides ratti TaxID=34506 RepID=A0A090L6Q5_STRRB|nr:Ubiquitin carboxyl-terminal hydrolase 48 [Strongyloides ratti]CEF65427.1 Ubiquitin carboxyl-terminal hydrolase 48 [Strongyloides ratti]
MMKNKIKRKFNSISKVPDRRDILTRELIYHKNIVAVDESLLFDLVNLNKVLCDHDTFPNKKANCKQYSRCLECINNDVWKKIYEKVIDEEEGNNINLRPIQDKPCGLNNTGNHCYVNSFIQIWFSFTPFRRAIYDFMPIKDFVPKDPKMNIQDIILALKKLFITMQITPFEDACALPLITLLKLDNEQNDALEFTTLFFSSLERGLENHPNGGKLRNLLQTCLNCRQEQTLVCSCGHKSNKSMESCGFHLHIEDVKTLPMAINKYFSTERLEDFKCSGCFNSGHVEKQIKITKFPPVLLIQLNRVSYDALGRNVKIKTPIEYPMIINSSMINNELDEEIEYELFAVMIHEGKESHCGHYYDIIKEPSSGKWFKYNDRLVEEVKTPGYIDEPTGKIRSDMKGCYALLYKMKNLDEPIPNPDDNQRSLIENELNDLFKIQKEGTLCDKLWRHVFKKYYNIVYRIFNKLKIPNVIINKENMTNFVWFPTNLIKEFNMCLYQSYSRKKAFSLDINEYPEQDYNFDRVLDRLENEVYQQNTCPSISVELCCHQKVHMELILSGKMKAVQREAAEDILSLLSMNIFLSKNDSEYVPCSLLTIDNICLECFQILIQKINYENSFEETKKIAKKIILECSKRVPEKILISNIHKDNLNNGYWVSKDELRNYEKLALLSIGEKFKTDNSTYSMAFANDISNIGMGDTDNCFQQQNSDVSPKKIKNNSELDSFSGLELFMQDKVQSLLFNETLKCQHGNLSTIKKRTYITENEWNQLVKPFADFYAVPYQTPECCECIEIQNMEESKRQDYISKIYSIKKTLGPTLKTIENRNIMENESSFSLGICKQFLKNLINFRNYDKVDEITGICQECVLCEDHNMPYLSPEMKKYSQMLAPVNENEWNFIQETISNFGFDINSKKIFLNREETINSYEFCNDCNNKALEDQENSKYIYPDGGSIFVRIVKDDNNCDKNEVSRFGRRSKKNELSIKMFSTETIYDLKIRIANEIRCDVFSLSIFNGGKELNNTSTLEQSKVPQNNEDYPLQAIVYATNGSQETVCNERPIEKGFRDTVLGL